MARSYVRFAVAIFCLALVFGFGGSVGVAHAEPGPRPTLTPIPPAAEPVVEPAVPAPQVAPAAVEEPAPTARPRRTFQLVVTPIAPVQPIAPAPETTDLIIQPEVQGATINVRYAAPGPAAPAAVVNPVQPPTAYPALLSYRALLVGLITLNVIGICLLIRRRFATL